MAPSLSTVLPIGSGEGSLSSLGLVGIVVGSCLLWRVGLLVYRVFFHPLSRYPGPKLYAASNFPWVWKSFIGGTSPREAIALHQKYGPIVRIGPDKLAVDGSVGFPQVYQHRPGQPEWSKKRGYFHENDELGLIGGTPEVHRRQRRQINSAFSDSSMYEQEPIVKQYVDLLCQRLGEKAATGETFDIVRWFNFMTFDVIGDLMFADSFHSLDGGNYHPWVLGIFEGVRGLAFRHFVQQYPWIGPVFLVVAKSSKSMAKLIENQNLAADKAMHRKQQGESPGGRRDFMTYILRKNRDGEPGFSDFEIKLNSPLLVTAGSETTATALSSLIWHLGQPKYRHIYTKLCDEIRSTFDSEDEIDMKSTARLTYLPAVLEENLRIYPPAAETPPRISPGAELNGEYIPKGVEVSIYQLATNHNPANFTDPDSFRPERFLPTTHPDYDPAFAGDVRASFRPFSFGPRDCVGKNLALSELRVTVARILHRFDYELAPGQEDWVDSQLVFIVWGKPALQVVLKERRARE